MVFSEPSDDLNDLNFFNQKKKKKKSKKVFDNDIEESLKVWRKHPPPLFCTVTRVCCCNLLVVLLTLFAHHSPAHVACYDIFQELKIEGEQPEVLEEDNLDLMLPEKKKKTKKVDFDESDTLDKDDGANKS